MRTCPGGIDMNPQSRLSHQSVQPSQEANPLQPTTLEPPQPSPTNLVKPELADQPTPEVDLLSHDALEEAWFSRAGTVMIDDVEQEIDLCQQQFFQQRSLRYVQGVAHGQRAYLITNLVGGESQTLLQPQMVWTIGRNREAALPLPDRALSRRHSVILYLVTEGFYLIDLNSMNGSYINGVRVKQRQALHDGDLVRIGNTEFLFFISSEIRSLEPIHPVVAARFASETRNKEFIDYAALEEPIVLFSQEQP